MQSAAAVAGHQAICLSGALLLALGGDQSLTLSSGRRGPFDTTLGCTCDWACWGDMRSVPVCSISPVCARDELARTNLAPVHARAAGSQ